MIFKKNIFTISLTLGLMVSICSAQDLKDPQNSEPTKKEKKNKAKNINEDLLDLPTIDSIAKPKPYIPRQGSIEAVINESTPRNNGMITTISQGDRQYFIIPSEIFGRDILVVNRLSQASALLRAGFDGYAGDMINENMIRFKPSPDSKNVFIEIVSTREIPRDTNGELYDLVMRSNLQPIGYSMPIRGRSSNSDSILVDATEFLNSNTELISFSEKLKRKFNISNYHKEKSYVKSMKSYPTNTELRTIKSYTANVQNGTNPNNKYPKSVTFEINSSMVLLPEKPMTPRYADPRVGYFCENYIDYEQDPHGVRPVSMIARYRLEPKPEDVAKYLAGELVEPKKPIVYYIDPLTPAKWVPYMMKGVTDWQVAFERAGFKNAIQAKLAPTVKGGDQDIEDWSLEDARFSAIVYKPSDIPNASGPHVKDPRSGEIIESHINWYHNVMQLVKRWYMIQAGPNDTLAQNINFPDSLMGELIRFISSHEVGHTLGLRHNFAGTFASPIDSLRSKTYLKKHGHTTSIMDYSRFNYVVQPEDSIPRELLYPRIQEYDLWAIEYGYRWYNKFESPLKEREMLCKLVEDSLSNNPRLWFGHERNPNDPRSQSEDLSSNQMIAAELGIRNLIRVANKLPEWTITPNQGYANLHFMYEGLQKQYIVYLWNVSKWIGGIYENPSTSPHLTPVYTHVEPAKQYEALKFLNQHFFRTPTWIMNPNILNKIGMNPSDVMSIVQINVLNQILSERVLTNLLNAESLSPRSAFTVNNLYTELNSKIFSELNSSRKPDLYRRMLHKLYVSKLMELAGYNSLGNNYPGMNVTKLQGMASDIQSTALYQLQQLQTKLSAAQSSDPVIKAHYNYLANQIKIITK